MRRGVTENDLLPRADGWPAAVTEHGGPNSDLMAEYGDKMCIKCHHVIPRTNRYLSVQPEVCVSCLDALAERAAKGLPIIVYEPTMGGQVCGSGMEAA